MSPPPDGVEFKEWAECRTSIGRFDGYLKDLRVYGFTIITTLLGAGAFFGFIPLEPDANSPIPFIARISVVAAIVLLVSALFYLDTYYEVLIGAAVGRARVIEAKFPDLALSNHLWQKSRQFRGRALRDTAYWTFFGIPVALGMAMIVTEVTLEPSGQLLWSALFLGISGLFAYRMWDARERAR